MAVAPSAPDPRHAGTLGTISRTTKAFPRMSKADRRAAQRETTAATAYSGRPGVRWLAKPVSPSLHVFFSLRCGWWGVGEERCSSGPGGDPRKMPHPWGMTCLHHDPGHGRGSCAHPGVASPGRTSH